MAKYRIGVGRLVVSGCHRHEIGSWLIEMTTQLFTDPDLKRRVDDIVHIPIAQVPTTTARCRIVEAARKNEVDILFQVDDDMVPAEGFFKEATLFLMAHKGPAVIASPYCMGGKNQLVNVFEFQSPRNDPVQSFALKHIPREDAARRKGVERVANIGTGLWACNMEVFDRFEERYGHRQFCDYRYDPTFTKVIETDDTFLGRHLYFADVPIYCDWNCWSGHWKQTLIEKPWVIDKAEIERTYLDQARAEMKREEKDG